MDSPSDRDVAVGEAAFEARFKEVCRSNATVCNAVMMIQFGVPPVNALKAACIALAEDVNQLHAMLTGRDPIRRGDDAEFAALLTQQLRAGIAFLEASQGSGAITESSPANGLQQGRELKPVAVKVGPTTCGPLYRELLNSLTFDVPRERRAFACGFMVGQAEKVFLGVCDAAMFRPSPERLDTVRSAVTAICEVYGLRQMELTVSTGVERWIFRDDAAAGKLLDLKQTPENSPEWHARRARLCGIPAAQVDPRFHERVGYGEKCD